MSSFLDNFRPDPEMPEQRIWRTSKPLMRGAVVTYAPFDPEYPELEVEEPTNDPSCASARVIGDEIDVVLYSSSGTFGDPHERAWKHILDHRQTVEASLRRKLFAQHSKSLQQFREEELPKEYQDYWQTISDQVKWNDPSAIDQLFKLVAVGLADTGLDECGFSSFEFQTGWDRDHGLGILMHKDRVLAAGGMTELIDGPSVESIRYIQGYDLDDGDFSLMND
ncbi:hypothetical protein EON82_05525 [bacterium]|nr:MAG: hypothetical protein EON82_05525 [bacterium]